MQGDLAAVLDLAGAISAWQAESRLASITPVEELVPMQIALLLECKLQALLLQPSATVEPSASLVRPTLHLFVGLPSIASTP